MLQIYTTIPQDESVQPVYPPGSDLRYGTTLTEKSAEKLQVAQRAMERAMLGITLLDRKRNEWIRRNTKVVDVVATIDHRKWRWAGHVAHMDTERWTRRTLEWRPSETTRGRGRPPERWVNDIRRHACPNWMQRARNRTAWRNMEEAYVRRRTDQGL